MWVFAVEALAAVAASSSTPRTSTVRLFAETLSAAATGFDYLFFRVFLSLQHPFIDRFALLTLSTEGLLVGCRVVAALAPTPRRTRCSLSVAGAVEFETAGLLAVAEVLVVAVASASVLLLLVLCLLLLCILPIIAMRIVMMCIMRQTVIVVVGQPRHFYRSVVERYGRLRLVVHVCFGLIVRLWSEVAVVRVAWVAVLVVLVRFRLLQREVTQGSTVGGV